MRALAGALLAVALAPLARAASEHYTFDPVHTRIVFRISHDGFSQSLGTFSGTSGTLDFDEDDWTGARLAVEIPLQRLDLGNDAWKAKALSAMFLDAERQPVARFVSTGVQPIDATHAKVTGTLSLRGSDSTVVLDVTMNALKRSLYTKFRKTAGFSATAKLHRKDLGMEAMPGAVGEDVVLEIEAEANARAPAEPPEPKVPEPLPPPGPAPEPSTGTPE